ncbi:hypothetical protein KUCAC02_037962, partial [Chaenocephalus aceratus]
MKVCVHTSIAPSALHLPSSQRKDLMREEETPCYGQRIPVSEHGAWATAMNNLGILPVGLRGPPLLS